MRIGWLVLATAVVGCGDSDSSSDAAMDASSDVLQDTSSADTAVADTSPGDTAPVDAGTCATDLVGSFGVTSIEGGPPADSSNSTFIFNDDGTYTWCLNYAGYMLDDSGSYELNGALLSVTGRLPDLTATDPIPLFDCTADSFRFRDDENDAWTYERDPDATGCAP